MKSRSIFTSFAGQVNTKLVTGSQNKSIATVKKQKNSVVSRRYPSKKPRILKGMQILIIYFYFIQRYFLIYFYLYIF